jgi:type IV pilus assembly protein PilN
MRNSTSFLFGNGTWIERGVTMLVEINLLPKREPKTSALFAITLILLFLFAIGASLVFWQARTNEASLQELDREIEAVQKLNTALQGKITEKENNDSFAELQSAVTWAEEFTPETVRLLRSLIALLPEQGFIQFFNYNDKGTINLRIQVESSRDAAYFLSSLKQSEWVRNASVIFIETAKKDETATDKDIESATVMPAYFAEFEIHFNKEFFTQRNDSSGGDET